ncbi:MAG: acyl-ACP--UDP-N-acetylglucosamine O-acyltransferase [Candidatus Riflebacteria bacterium]|nr:acyl-ACP--UDP-N-acetylglucosamine O-acyltransferase [Candidatus Riflebacteria bacterium]
MSDADRPPAIHPTAIVDPGARLHRSVEVGPWCVVGPEVTIGEGTILLHNTTVTGRAAIGASNRIGPYAAIGLPPQHIHDDGSGSSVEIGDKNVIREFVTIHLATKLGGSLTKLGNDNYLMAYAHIAHDCKIGNNVIVANACNLGGHVTVKDRAVLGGMAGFHQFVTVGEFTMVGGASAVRNDVPPYCMVEGNTARLRGLNLIGLKRNGFTADTVRCLKRAYRVLFRSRLTVDQAARDLERELGGWEVVRNLVEFVRTSKRGVCR